MKTTTKLIYTVFAVLLFAIEAVTARATGDLFASINGTGSNGGGFIYQYRLNGLQRTFASGLSRPRGVAFGPSGSLFVGTNTFDAVTGTFQASIVRITRDGVQSAVATLSGDLFAEGVAFDLAGNLFVVAIVNTDPNGASIIFKITPNGTQSTFGTTPGQGLGLAFDSAGNLFAADFSDHTIYKFLPDGTQSIFVGPSAFDPGQGPSGLVFDSSGNLFVSAGTADQEPDAILEFTPDGMESTFATGLNSPRGVAFDRRGNLFVAEIIQDGPGDILKFTPDGSRTVFAVVPGAGNSGPEFLAFPSR